VQNQGSPQQRRLIYEVARTGAADLVAYTETCREAKIEIPAELPD
jgi:hypothetical protein